MFFIRLPIEQKNLQEKQCDLLSSLLGFANRFWMMHAHAADTCIWLMKKFIAMCFIKMC